MTEMEHIHGLWVEIRNISWSLMVIGIGLGASAIGSIMAHSKARRAGRLHDAAVAKQDDINRKILAYMEVTGKRLDALEAEVFK